MSIDIQRWGKDHWTTFAFLCHRVVDHRGVVEIERMRCDPKVHPFLAHRGSRMGKPSPTRLRKVGDDVETVPGHDDWSCFADMCASGFMNDVGTGVTPVVELTESGWKLWFEFQRHIAANPGQWSTTFVPSDDLVAFARESVRSQSVTEKETA